MTFVCPLVIYRIETQWWNATEMAQTLTIALVTETRKPVAGKVS